MNRSTRRWEKLKRNFLNFVRYRLRVTVTWRLVGYVALTMAIVVLGWVLLQSNLFQVKTISFTNTDWPTYVSADTTTNELRASVRKQSIFTADVQKIADSLMNKEPFIQKALVTKQVPDSLLVSLTFYKPAIAVYYKEYCHILGDQGTVLRELPVEECKAFTIPRVKNTKTEQNFYSSIYVQHIVQFTEYLRLNNQPVPDEYEFTNDPRVEIVARFKDHAVRLAVDQDVLYNYLVYSAIRQSSRASLLRSKTLDLTTREPFLY